MATPTTEGKKFDEGKTRYDLIPFHALEEITKVLTYRAEKYDDNDWRHVNPWQPRYLRAALGHIMDWARGEVNDQESGLHHLAHAACSIMFLIERSRTQPGQIFASEMFKQQTKGGPGGISGLFGGALGGSFVNPQK